MVSIIGSPKQRRRRQRLGLNIVLSNAASGENFVMPRRGMHRHVIAL
jgi:hypothetical protein